MLPFLISQRFWKEAKRKSGKALKLKESRVVNAGPVGS